MDPVFDERIQVGNIWKVTMDDLARLNEAVGDVNCVFIDGRVVAFASIVVSKILNDGRLVTRIWIPDVCYVPVEEFRNYIIVKVGEGKVVYTNDVKEARPDDAIIPVLNFPSSVVNFVRERLKEEK